jgi:probable rRNA maturation factor
MPNPLVVEVRLSERRWEPLLQAEPAAFVQKILAAAARHTGRAGEVAVLLTHDAEMRTLNRTWKSKDKPTNVLSFPAPEGFGSLGDIALGLETIAAEAEAQAKSAANHAAHLLVHGYLHLLGMDHQNDNEAAAMEDQERAILAGLGIADPYLGEVPSDDHQGAARER